jgi:hypothetical protein
MKGRYRAGIVGVMLGLLAYFPAAAQSGDTSTVVVDTSSVAANSSSTATDSAEPVVLRMIDDSIVRGWRGEKAYEYANDSAYWRWYAVQVQSGRRTERRTTQFLPGKWLEYFLLFLLAAVLLYAIVRIIVTNRLQLFYRSPKRMTAGNAGVEEFTPEDDLEGQLTHFVQIKNYREAVRYLYLKTLRLLNDRGMIRYHPESTNQEYWQQLSATPQGRPFRDLITIYENVWYGEFSMGDALFIRLRGYFDDFYKSVQA